MIHLASRSPQRCALLQNAGLALCVVPSDCDEDAIQAPLPKLLALERARAKAAGARLAPALLAAWPAGDVILGADTVVAVGSQVLGNPSDETDARRMLGLLSGTRHTVYTACCLRIPPGPDDQPAREAVALSLAHITMRTLSEAEIASYVASGESHGRAGAYAIQENGDRFVVEREGEFDTVVGLNLASLRRLYRELLSCEPEAAA